AFSGAIDDSTGVSGVSLIKTGSGTQVLSGSNTYSGGTTISGGTLRLGAANALSGDVTDNGALDLHGFSDTIGALKGSGTVASTAAGAVTVTVGSASGLVTFAGNIQNGSGTVA